MCGDRRSVSFCTRLGGACACGVSSESDWNVWYVCSVNARRIGRFVEESVKRAKGTGEGSGMIVAEVTEGEGKIFCMEEQEKSDKRSTWKQTDAAECTKKIELSRLYH